MSRARQRGRLLSDIVLLVLYVALTATLCIHHESWRDEADGWLAARDHTLNSLFSFTGYVGNPCLWFLVQMPFARGGLPYEAQGWINLAIAVAAVVLFLRLFPWPDTVPPWLEVLTKSGVVFSYYVAFEYAAIARSYALSMLLIFACAAAHRERFRSPVTHAVLLVLLMNTNVQGLLLACVISAFTLVEYQRRAEVRRRYLPAVLVVAAGIACVGWQLFPPADRQQVAPTLTQGGMWDALYHALGNAVIPTRRVANPFAAGVGYWLNVAALAGVAISLRKAHRSLCLLVALVAALLLLFAVVYYGGIRHAGFLFLYLVYALWVALSEEAGEVPPWAPKTAMLLLAPALLGSCLVTARISQEEVARPFSGAKDAARFIVEANLAQTPIAAYPDPIASAVLAYLPRRDFWYLGRQEQGSHMAWDQRMVENRRLPADEVTRRINSFAGQVSGPCLVLLGAPWLNGGARFELLYHTKETPFTAADERYWLYREIETPDQGNSWNPRPAGRRP